MKTLRERVLYTSTEKNKFFKDFSGRYACNICGTPIQIKAVPKKSTYFYNICCPSCNIVLTGTSAQHKSSLFLNALKEGYIKPIDK